MDARHERSTAEDANLAIVETLVNLLGKVMPRCADGVHESPFAVSIVVVRVGKDARGSRFAVLLYAIMAEFEARLFQFLQQVLAHLIIAPAAIETDLALLVSQLRSIDKGNDTGTSHVFLVSLVSFG